MEWLRTQRCVVTGSKAECAHHIRLGTNGGAALKPSDYFCIPLENEYHTHGPLAVHKLGEDSFLRKFKLDKEELFINQLSLYLKANYQIVIEHSGLEKLIAISLLIDEIEKRRRAKKVSSKAKKKTSKVVKVDTPKLSETEYYQKAKELKKSRDKELRDSLSKSKIKTKSVSLKGNEFYEKAKELKKEQDRALRKEMKKQSKPQQSAESFDYYEKVKQEQKLKAREYRKAQYQKLKQLKSEQK